MVTDTDYNQAKTIIGATVAKYNKKDIEEALSLMDKPPYIQTDLGELSNLFQVYEKTYGSEIFWRIIQEKGLGEIPSEKKSGKIYWSFSFNRIININVNGKYEYKSLPQNSWELRILEDNVQVKILLSTCNSFESEGKVLEKTVLTEPVSISLKKEARIVKAENELRIITDE